MPSLHSRFAAFRSGRYYRHVRAAGSVAAIFELILANVIGFSAGIDGGETLCVICLYLIVPVRSVWRS